MVRLGFAFVKEEGGVFTLVDSGVAANERAKDEPYQAFKQRIIRYWIEEFPAYISFLSEEGFGGEIFVASETVPAATSGGNFIAATQSELVKAAIVACQVIAYQHGVEWQELGATTIKKAVAGNGKATKIKVANANMNVFPELKEQERDLKDNRIDESDAIAVGLAALGYKALKG